MDSYIAEFNREFSSKNHTGNVKIETFNSFDFPTRFMDVLQLWMGFHNVILNDFLNNILVVQYEKLNINLIEEMNEILKFLGFTMTREIESCLLTKSEGQFKRLKRPPEEINKIYNSFSKEKLNYFDNIYMEYLQRFENKL